MKVIAELFYTINHSVFDCVVNKKAAITLGIIYFIVSTGGLIYLGPLLPVKNNNGVLQMSLVYYVVILCFITVVAYRAFLKFTKYTVAIVYEAKSVELTDPDIQKVRKWSYHIIRHYVPVLTLPISAGVTFVFLKKTELDLLTVDLLEIYAGLLVFFAALSTILAYATLILDIFAIQAVYNSTFNKYVFLCPVSTKIFREYNKIITHGLIRFWAVGSCVLFLTFIVVEHKDPIFIAVVSLAIIGFILFTFFPFYITKKKIIELKMESIESLVDTENVQGIQSSESSVKLILESPSQISTNYYTLYWSTLLAIISALVSLKDMLPQLP